MSITNLHESVARTVKDTIELMLGISVAVNDECKENTAEHSYVGGVVHILGDWRGSVAFNCSQALAEHAAKNMFQLAGSAADKEQIDDALRELANILGGNLKTVLGTHCILSVPKTMQQINSTSGVQEGTRIIQVDFECDGEPLTMSVYKSDVELHEDCC